MAAAWAGVGDAPSESAKSILSSFGGGPAFSDLSMGMLGVGMVWADTDLFETISPELTLPFTPTASLTGGAAGVGAGTFLAEVGFNMPSRERRNGSLTTEAPFHFSALYCSGGNLLSLVGKAELPVGFGPSIVSHSGFQGPLRVGIDKVGQMEIAELMHWHLGAGGTAYARAGKRFLAMGHFGYLPAFNSLLTLGTFEGRGRFTLADPEIFVPIDEWGEVVAGLIEQENHFRYRDSVVFGGRILAGPVVLSYHQRRVNYAPKPGSGVDPNARFRIVTHQLSLSFGAAVGGE